MSVLLSSPLHEVISRVGAVGEELWDGCLIILYKYFLLEAYA